MSLDIAITGMSVRLPASDTPWELHRMLAAGESAITHFGEQRTGWIGARGLIERHDWFDTQRFRLAESEAKCMDPQHRLALEEAVKALESAGYRAGSQALDCGVFASCSASHAHWQACLEQDADNAIARYNVLLGNDKDFLATRIAWHLDLTGPAMSVQSGCSSSLVALHQACQAIQQGDCSMALVAGVSLTLPLEEGSPVSEGMIFSPSGSCNPYTSQADGTVGGTGAVVLVLQRLEDAVSQGAPCWGVIKGSAINNDGRKKVSFTAPGIDQQVAVMQRALRKAGVAPDDIGFIEGHGTGTSMGDSIELAALMEVYGQQASLPSLGSIKASIGHLDAASGLAGVARCLLSLQHQVIYPQPRLTQASAQSPFPLEAEAIPWGERSPLIAVTSLGVGGTNAHVVLAPSPERKIAALPGPFWIPLAGENEEGLRLLARQLLDIPQGGESRTLPLIAWTLQQRYRDTHLSCRCDLKAEDIHHYRQQLEQLAADTPLPLLHCQTPPAPLSEEDDLWCIPLPATPLNSHCLYSDVVRTLNSQTKPDEAIREAISGGAEAIITAAWQKCLGFNDKPSATNHFFEQGGNSLLAVQLVQTLKQQGISGVSIADLYEAPQLAGFIQRLTRHRHQMSEQDEATDHFMEL